MYFMYYCVDVCVFKWILIVKMKKRKYILCHSLLDGFRQDLWRRKLAIKALSHLRRMLKKWKFEMALGLGRWFQRFRIFESGFCPFRFLSFKPPQTKGHMLHKNVLLPYAISARIWILAFRIWYSNCKSQY